MLCCVPTLSPSDPIVLTDHCPRPCPPCDATHRPTTAVFDHHKQYLRAKTVTPFSINDGNAEAGGMFNPLASYEQPAAQVPAPLPRLTTPLDPKALLLRHGGSSCKSRPGRVTPVDPQEHIRGRPARLARSSESQAEQAPAPVSCPPSSASSGASSTSAASQMPCIADALSRIATALEGLVEIDRRLSAQGGQQ